MALVKKEIEFNFVKSIHMYNHQLTVTYDNNSYTSIIEDSPFEKDSVLVWIDDFRFPDEDINYMRIKISSYLNDLGYDCIFQKGKRS